MAEVMDDAFFTGEPSPEPEAQPEPEVVESAEPAAEAAESVETAAPDSGDPLAEPVEGVESATEEQAEADPYAEFSEKPELVAAMKAAADRVKHLDPSNPEHLKTIRAFAEKDLEIQRLRSPEALTEYEKSLRENKADEPEKKAEAEQRPEPNADDYTFENVTRGWRDYADGIRAEVEEWNKGEKADFGRIAAIQNARTLNLTRETVLPAVQAMVQQMLQERLGEAEPYLQESVRERKSREATEFALEQLEKVPGYESIRSLYQSENGEPSPVQQVLKESPHILDIRKQGRDAAESDRLTRIAQLKAVQQEWTRLQRSGEESRKAIEVGQKIESRNREQATRQSLNKGTGTNQLNGGSQGDLVDEIIGAKESVFA